MTPEKIAAEPNYWVRRILTDRYMERRANLAGFMVYAMAVLVGTR